MVLCETNQTWREICRNMETKTAVRYAMEQWFMTKISACGYAKFVQSGCHPRKKTDCASPVPVFFRRYCESEGTYGNMSRWKVETTPADWQRALASKRIWAGGAFSLIKRTSSGTICVWHTAEHMLTKDTQAPVALLPMLRTSRAVRGWLSICGRGNPEFMHRFNRAEFLCQPRSA